MGEGLRLRLAEGEELCKPKVRGQRVGLGRERLGTPGKVKASTLEELTTWRQKDLF
jgi:hypothetical protein